MAESTLHYNATVLTMDEGRSRANALLVDDGVVAAVGNRDDIKGASQGSEQVDLDGATVVPGFDDCHMHVLSMGLNLARMDLRPSEAPSIPAIQQVVARQAAAAPSQGWLLGRGYNQNLLAERRHPTASDLDPHSDGRPLAIWHTSGHVMVVNSAAMATAGIGPETPDPDGGEIERDGSGAPTGVLKENAMGLIRSSIPPPTESEARDAILAASAVLASEGITSASDAATGQTLDLIAEIEAYGQAVTSNRMKTRIVLMPLIGLVTGDNARRPQAFDLGVDPRWLSIGAAKVFTDGALTTRTAALREPYLGGSSQGILTWDSDDLARTARQAASLGWRLALHAIGDGAVEQTLETLSAIPNVQSMRPRIEHATLCDREQIRRMAGLGVTVVLQPEDIAVLGDAYPPSIGDERAGNNSPVGWFQQAGVPIAFSSDRPVTPGNPLVGVQAAVQRRTSSWNILGIEHEVSPETALKLYTGGGAFATGSENWRGRLTPGMVADFVVLDRDITACDPDDISRSKVLRTVVDGRTVFKA